MTHSNAIDPDSDFRLIAVREELPRITPQISVLKDVRWKLGRLSDRVQDAAEAELWNEAIAYVDDLLRKEIDA